MAVRLLLAVALTLSTSCMAPMGGGSDPRSAIEDVLARRATAAGANDLAAFRATVDAARPALRRTQQDVFEVMRLRGATAMTKVVKVEAYGTYTRAYVEDPPERMLLGTSGPPSYRRMYFRQNEGNWVVSEPKVDQLGGEKRTHVGEVEIVHWEIDDDIASIVASALNDLRSELARTTPSVPVAPISARLYPTSETIGLAGVPGAAAAHPINASRDTTLRIYDLWWSSPGQLAPFSTFVFKDQLLGMAREQAVPLAYLRMDWWLRHGLGLAVGGPDASDSRKAVCAEPLTWKQMFDGPQRDAPMGGGDAMGGDALAPTYFAFMSSTTPRAFVQARSMVDHLRSRHGERAYWDLVRAYAEGSGASTAYMRAIGLAPERFYSDWLARC